MKTILLAEDNIELQNLMRARLESGGFNVITAVNGAAALRILKQNEVVVDAIVTDLQMPIMDGAEFTRRARAEGFGQIIIMWSGDLDPQMRELNGFIAKEQARDVIKLLQVFLNETESVA